MFLSKNLVLIKPRMTLTPARPAPLIFPGTFIKRALRLSGHTPAVIRFHGENGEKRSVCARACVCVRGRERVGERALHVQARIAAVNCPPIA